MVGYEMLALEQRDLTPEQVRLLNIWLLGQLPPPSLHVAMFVCFQAAEKLRNLPDTHYKDAGN